MRHGPRALVAALACLLAPTAAFAQECDTCGPRVGNSYSGGHDRNCNRIYPRFESRYIRQFCGPHLSPDACFGYFKTQVTPWGQACPSYGGHTPPDAAAPGTPQAAVTPAAPASIPPAAPLAAPRPADAPVPTVPAPDAPKPPTAPLPKLAIPNAPRPMPETPR